MAKPRIYRDFTEAELKTIKEKNGKISLLELSKLLNINYSSLSSMINQHKVQFSAQRKPTYIKKESPAMTKTKNDEGELLLTDEMTKGWF